MTTMTVERALSERYPDAQVRSAVECLFGVRLDAISEALVAAEAHLRRASGSVDTTASLASVLLARSCEEADPAMAEEAGELLAAMGSTPEGRAPAAAILTEFADRGNETALIKLGALLASLTDEEAAAVKDEARRLIRQEKEFCAELHRLRGRS